MSENPVSCTKHGVTTLVVAERWRWLKVTQMDDSDPNLKAVSCCPCCGGPSLVGPDDDVMEGVYCKACKAGADGNQ